MVFNFNKISFVKSAARRWPLVAMLLFFILSMMGSSVKLDKLNSPDETANYFFIKQFAQSGELSVREELNLVSPIVHQRSVNVRGDQLVPGGFIGLILLY